MCWTNDTYNKKLNKLENLKAQRTILDAEIKALEDAIKADMGDLEILDTNRYTVRFTRFETNRFDSKAFGKVHPKLLAEFTKTSEGRRFSFTAKTVTA